MTDVDRLRRPNFFIAGAPKCGTTSLAEYLRSHPRVFVSWPKEPGYFARDFPEFSPMDSLEEYEAVFEPASSDHLAIGEASTCYLYSSVALPNILEYRPDARIIAMLRDPIEIAVAWHREMLFTYYETVENFQEAWKLQDARRQGVDLPDTCRVPAFLQYRSIARLGDQVERLLDVFPADQVKFVLLDDLAASPRDVYVNVLEFLEVPDDGRTDFPVVNERKEHRYDFLGRLLMSPPPFVRRVESAVKSVLRSLGIFEYRFWRRFIYSNTRPAPKTQLSPSFKRELARTFEPDVRKLESLIGRDLSHWLG